MLEWFSELPKWLKYGVAVTVLALAGGLHFMGIFWPWAWGIGVALLVGAILLD